MQQIAATKQRGGKRRSVVEVERAAHRTGQLLAFGYSRHEILDALQREFGLAPRSGDQYLRRVRDEWKKQESETTAAARQAARVRCYGYLREARERNDLRGVLGFERHLADLEGTRQPPMAAPATPEQDFSGPPAGLAALTVEELDQVIATGQLPPGKTAEDIWGYSVPGFPSGKAPGSGK